MRGKAFLFGLNYQNVPGATLSGCINDVRNMAAYLQKELAIPCEIYTDDVNFVDTSAMGMLRRLYEIAMQTYRDQLDFVWIHYSGHGTSILDTSGEERDGMDECLVPNDFQTAGVIPDDYINALFSYFNPNTKVICVFDCCHSGTIGDVKYSWEGPTKCSVENIMCEASARIVCLSGCLDNQTSADAYNVMNDGKYVGALTACLLMSLQENKVATWSNVFTLVQMVRDKLKQRGYTQICKLTSTYNLAKEPRFI